MTFLCSCTITHMQGGPGSVGLAGTEGDDGARGLNGNLGFPGPAGVSVRKECQLE